jgi:hypothetical protein
VLRFYETPASTFAGSNKRKAKIPIPVAPIREIFASRRQAAGNSNLKQSCENRASLIFQTIYQQVSGSLNCPVQSRLPFESLLKQILNAL